MKAKSNSVNHNCKFCALCFWSSFSEALFYLPSLVSFRSTLLLIRFSLIQFESDAKANNGRKGKRAKRREIACDSFNLTHVFALSNLRLCNASTTKRQQTTAPMSTISARQSSYFRAPSLRNSSCVTSALGFWLAGCQAVNKLAFVPQN